LVLLLQGKATFLVLDVIDAEERFNLLVDTRLI
jgi:hypothetical protein